MAPRRISATPSQSSTASASTHPMTSCYHTCVVAASTFVSLRALVEGRIASKG